MKYEIDEETMEACKELEYYDLHGHFPYEKKVVPLSLSYKSVEKIKNLENKSKIIEELIDLNL